MKRPRRPRTAGEIPGGFVRGFVASGLLAAVQGRAARLPERANRRRILRLALQGGTALAAGSAAAEALQRRQWTAVLTAVAGGTAGLLAIEHLLREETSREMHHGQEKA